MLHLDYGELPGGVERTPQGGLRIPATLTRTGVLVYRNADGTERRELRHPEDVFQPESLASLRGAPVTVDHPTGAVTAGNWRDLAVGHVADNVRRADNHVDADIVVQDVKAVTRVDSSGPDKLREMSCGYDCDYEKGPGIYNGERYDGRQKNIRYNHVALGPRGWGRAGMDVALHMDSATYAHTDMADNLAGATTAPNTDVKVVPLAEFERVRADADGLRGQLSGVNEQLAALDKRAKAQEARADAAERVALLTSLAGVLPKDFKADGKPPREIKVAAIQALRPDFKADGKSDEFVDAYLEAMPRKDAEANPLASLGRGHTDAADQGVSIRNEDGSEDKALAAKRRWDSKSKTLFTTASGLVKVIK